MPPGYVCVATWRSRTSCGSGPKSGIPCPMSTGTRLMNEPRAQHPSPEGEASGRAPAPPRRPQQRRRVVEQVAAPISHRLRRVRSAQNSDHHGGTHHPETAAREADLDHAAPGVFVEELQRDFEDGDPVGGSENKVRRTSKIPFALFEWMLPPPRLLSTPPPETARARNPRTCVACGGSRVGG